MNLKVACLSLLMLVSVASAHDEGHGPKLVESSKQGGVLASVVEAKDAKLGPKAAPVYKAELIRSEDGTVRVYLYDKQMARLDISTFDKNAKAVLLVGKKKSKKMPFSLSLEEGAFIGKAPKASSRPFDIEITFKEGKRALLAAFENLD